MRNIEIIRPNINTGYEIVDIPENEVVIEYLKKIEPYGFKIIKIDEETRDEILSYNKLKNFPKDNNNSIVGYARNYKDGGNFRASGGLKLSSKKYEGTFIIEDKRIVYDPTRRFYEERDAFVYSHSIFNNFYTTSSMEKLLLEELRLNRKIFIYRGEKLINKPKMYVPDLLQVTEDELLDYSGINKNQEKQLVKKI